MANNSEVTDCFDGWQPCPDRMISEFVLRQNNERKIKENRRLFGVCVLVFLAVAIGRFTIQNSFVEIDHLPGNIACSEVQQLIPEFLDGTLTHEKAAQVLTHLNKCPHCNEFQKKVSSERELVLTTEVSNGADSNSYPDLRSHSNAEWTLAVLQ